jgi:cytochrome c oxidase subunit 2
VGGILEMTEDNIKDWIRDPQAIKPGSLMPGFGPGTSLELSEEELNQLTKYLLQLK